MLQNLNELLNKIELSFKASLKGEETIHNLIWWWGFVGYFVFYFIVDKIIKMTDVRIVDVALSAVGMIYFLWHIYAMRKCSPKKPKISKEEKKRLRAEAWNNAPRKFWRKLTLQEPISKWNPIAMTIAADLLFFVQFLGYVL